MDAQAQLALMTKAKLLFETPDTFLSFPALIPISFAPEEMNFATAGTAAQLQAFADFSQWTNALPQGPVFQPSLDNLLWDTYLGVLQNAQVAQGTLTADQAAQLAAAQGFISQQGSDGLLTDTPAMIAYRQYQQAFFAATEDYNNQKVTAATSADPNVKAAWANGGETSAASQVAAAQSDWQTKGYKAQVEQAQQIIRTLNALSPQQQWSKWVEQCNPTIDFLTNPSSGAQFGATLFEPFDMATNTNWPSFTLHAGDIPNLIAQAPAELKNIFGSTSGSSVIDSITFQYCSVAVTRSWFDSHVFSSRFWRFADPTIELSDGATSPSGDWPAYITAVVLARNIQITSHAAAATPQPTFPTVPPGVFHLQPRPAPRPIPIFLRPKQPIRVVTPGPHPVLPMRQVLPQIAATHTVLTGPPIEARTVPAASMTRVQINPALRARLASMSFSSVGLRAVTNGTNSNASSSGNSGSVTSPGDDRISVLAFICKQLPRCPDPDPSLQWT